MDSLIPFIPYFAGLISVLFIIGFLFALGEKVASDLDKDQREKIKNKVK
jgi:hypothetical protein